MSEKPKLLLGATGSVATIKLIALVDLLKTHFEVKVILTEHSMHFVKPSEITEKCSVKVHTDSEDWHEWKQKGDPILHIDLMKWADVLVIAPLSANTLAKLANGLCDNLLTCVARAWPIGYILSKELHYIIIDPIAKLLACGDYGVGAMAEVGAVAERVFHDVNEFKPHVNGTQKAACSRTTLSEN